MQKLKYDFRLKSLLKTKELIRRFFKFVMRKTSNMGWLLEFIHDTMFLYPQFTNQMSVIYFEIKCRLIR